MDYNHIQIPDTDRYGQRLKSDSKFTLVLLLGSATLTVMAGSIIAPVLNLIREGLGVGPSSAGIIITTHSLFLAISSPFIGILLDKIGTRKPFILGLIVYGLAGASGMFISTFWVLLLSRAFLGLATAAVFTSITVSILNLYEGGERNKVMGWRASSNSLGGVIWPLIGGALGGISWHAPFGVYLLGIPLGLTALFIIPDTRKSQMEQGEGGENLSVLGIFRTRPVLFAIYGLTFLGSILLYALVVYLPQQLEVIGISKPLYISLFISVSALSSGTTSLLFKRIKARLSYKHIALITLALWTAGFTTISQTLSPVIIALSVVLFGIGQGMLLPMVTVWLGEMVPASFRGRIASYLATFGLFGQFMSPVVFAPVVLNAGLSSVFIAAAIVPAVVFFLFLFMMKR